MYSWLHTVRTTCRTGNNRGPPRGELLRKDDREPTEQRKCMCPVQHYVQEALQSPRQGQMVRVHQPNHRFSLRNAERIQRNSEMNFSENVSQFSFKRVRRTAKRKKPEVRAGNWSCWVPSVLTRPWPRILQTCRTEAPYFVLFYLLRLCAHATSPALPGTKQRATRSTTAATTANLFSLEFMSEAGVLMTPLPPRAGSPKVNDG